MALRFPGHAVIEELEASGNLDNALTSYARVLLTSEDQKQVAQWCREYLALSTEKSVTEHSLLRKTVFFLIFRRRILIDSPIETVWDIVVQFGPKNETEVVQYLESTPRSVPLKFGRFLLYIAEFGRTKTISWDTFPQIITIVFGAVSIAQAVITPEWTRDIGKFRTDESRVIREISQSFGPGGPAQTLVSLFPQIKPSKVLALLKKTGVQVEELTQNILDNPNYVDETLSTRNKRQANTPRQKFVLLDEREKQKREDEVRRYNELHFTYEYVSLEEEDPDPEAETGPVQPELSEADKKLVQQEELLWSYWQGHSDVFDRSARKSELRRQLCAKLKWTDEQVEGWGRMIGQKGRHANEQVNLPKHMQEVATYAPTRGNDPGVGAGDGARSGGRPGRQNTPSRAETSKRPSGSANASKTSSKPSSTSSRAGSQSGSQPGSQSGSRSSTPTPSGKKKPGPKIRPKKSGKKNANPEQ